MIPTQTINQLNEVPIIEILKEINPGATFKRQGSIFFTHSIFSTEKTPSFAINPNNTFKCYSSQKGGSVITLVMQSQGLSFPEACQWIAEKRGIEIPKKMSPELEAQEKERAELKIKANKLAQYYIKHRDESFDAFLKARKISPESAETFQLGKCPAQDPEKKMRGRFMFPIWDNYGRVIGFGGRAPKGAGDDVPKYINSAESPIYQKRRVLYAWHLARPEVAKVGKVLLTEGYTDVISLHQAGIKYTTATSGTALTLDQAKLIKQITNDVVLLRDADNAGIKATIRDIKTLLSAGLFPSVLSLPAGQDPDDFVRSHGAQAGQKFEALLEAELKGWAQFLADRARSTHGKVNATTGEIELETKDKRELTKQLVANIKLIEDDISKYQFAQEAAKILDIDTALLFKKIGIKADAQAQDLLNAALQNPFRRSFASYERTLKALNLDLCPDFERTEKGFIEISYKDLKGAPLKIRQSNKSIVATRSTDQYERPNVIYIPPAMREDAGQGEPGALHPHAENVPVSQFNQTIDEIEAHGNRRPLYIVQDELSAYILTKFGVPAIGINRPGGFGRAKGQKVFTSELTKLIKAFKFRHLVLVMPGQAFTIPYHPKANQHERELAEYGLIHRDILVKFNQCLKPLEKCLNYALTPKAIKDLGDDLWLENLLINLLHDGHDIAQEFNGFISGNEPAATELNDLTYIREEKLEQFLKIDSAQSFFDHYAEHLAQEFKFRGRIYEVDEREGAVKLKVDEGDELSIFEKNGRYYSRARGQLRAISNFTLECQLEIKSEDSFNIYQLTGLNGQKVTAIISDADFADRSKFFKAIRRLKRVKASWLGSSQDCIELQCIVNEQAPEATPLNRVLGFHQADITERRESDKPFFVWGNGITDDAGNFLPIDERGLIKHQGRIYFLPAFSTIKTSDDPENKYRRERKFSFLESAITFDEWIEKFTTVHGSNAHATFFFYLAAINRDLFVNHFGRFPHLFLVGPKNAGKGTLQESIGALFGELMVMNLNDDPTTSAYRHHFSQYVNAFTVINEINPSSVPPWMVTGLKGSYDNQTRPRMAGPRSNEIDFGKVTSAVIGMGQEFDIYRQEAVATRSIFLECTKEHHSKEEGERYLDLKRIEVDEGLCHITAEFFAFRPVIKKHFKDKVSDLESRLKSMVKGTGIDSRLFFNWAVILAPTYILLEQGLITYPLSIKEILEYAVARIEDHASKLISKGVLEVFFSFIEAFYLDRAYELTDNHVWHDEGAGTLNIAFSKVYPKFLRYIKSTANGIENISPADIKRRMKKHPAFIPGPSGGGHNKVWLGYERDAHGNYLRKKAKKMGAEGAFWAGQGAGVAFKSSAYVFDYSKLNINIRTPRMPWDDIDDQDELGAGEVEITK